MSEQNRKSWEWLVFVIVIGLAVILMGSTYHYSKQLNDRRQLYYELQELRNAATTFKALNKRNPVDIKDLVTATIMMPNDITVRKLIDNPPKLVNGKYVDPFGNPFAYDAKTAWVKSTTPGYERW